MLCNTQSHNMAWENEAGQSRVARWMGPANRIPYHTTARIL